MELLFDPQAWIAFITLTALEIILGIDNIIVIAILTGKLPAHNQKKARLIGLSLAMFMRVGLLLSLNWVMSLTGNLFSVFGQDISGRDLILIFGGLFLLMKSTQEIHEKLESSNEGPNLRKVTAFAGVIIQILLLDIVFSLDSVITAIGMSNQIPIMVAAVCVAVIFMLFFSGFISHFVHKHPTIKILALSFLLMIGVMLIAEGFDQHVSKGYIYFAMAFSVFVEMINLRIRPTAPPELHDGVEDKP